MWFIKLMQRRVKDYAEAKGSDIDGVEYSCTKAMLPNHKESAYKHLPTYTAGIIFHIGLFTSFILLLLQLIIPEFLNSPPLGDKYRIAIKAMSLAREFSSGREWQDWLRLILGLCLCVSSCCGIAILAKRFMNKTLKDLSNLDDYISNMLVTLFQIASACAMLFPLWAPSKPMLFIVATILFLYIPFGKLRHFIYFFAARIHLGIFFGSRGVWSMKNKKK
ncbi:MAG: hypothetical protein PHR20_06605 [Bacteroidales bacterium]|nr:hypothetical protein [Bacteroidales bacterium]